MKPRKTAMLLAAVMVIVTVITVVPAAKVQASYVDDFLATVGPMCTNDMRDNHILASFSLAQAIWESGWGRSTLATQANNLFGIRAYSTWDGKVFDRNECVLYDSWADLVSTKGDSYVKSYSLSFWRAYDSWQESVNDHSGLFNRMSIYENLRGNYDYRSCAALIVQDGYCSDPGYTSCIINLIESYDLEQYNYDFGTGDGQDTPTDDDNSDVGNGSDDAVSISLAPAKLYMETGLSYFPTLTVSPAEAEYSFESSDPSVVTVSGQELIAAGAGTARVTLSSGRLSVSCQVTVADNYGGIVADGVFELCTVTEGTATVPDEATSIGKDAFRGSDVTTVIIGNGVTSVADGAFDGMGGGFTLCSYGNSIVSDYAVINAIAHVNISTGWVLDTTAALISGVSLYTTANLVSTYYGAEGITVGLADKHGVPLNGTAYVGTGCIISIGSVDYSAIVKGDTDGDGITSTSDLLKLKGYLSGDNDYLPSRPYRKAADINGDERITTADYLAIYRTFTA